jgi:glucose/arabinose dehydrogenase
MQYTKKILSGLGFLFGVIVLTGLAYIFTTYGALNIPRKSNIVISASSTLPFAVPAGYVMEVYAADVPDARVMAFDPGGAMIVSQPSQGKVVALIDTDADGRIDETPAVIDGLNVPHGLEFRCRDEADPTKCTLYIAEKDQLVAYEYDARAHKASSPRKLLDLPNGSIGSHVTRSLLFLAYPEEDTLLIAVGSSCNVCEESDDRRAKILYYNVATGETGEYARGLRNAVFMTLHPVSGAVWVTEMGRDGLGDDIPPDEINIITKGAWYGWPWFYGKNVEDMTFNPRSRPSFAQEPIPSTIDIPAHSAPLGLAFIPEEGWPEEDWYDLLVAYHGSWNRSVPTGYKIVKMRLDAQGNYAGTEDFITGFLGADGRRIGRPADIKALPGGTVYISDDSAGMIYRLSRTSL